MTTNLDKAFELANLMTVVANQKRALKEEFEQATLYFYNGGTFTADRLLISFLFAIKTTTQSNMFVVIDDNGNPIQIEDLNKFFDDIVNLYAQSSNAYLTGYQTIKTHRSISNILDL